jgi:hypothetical protein
MANGFPVFLDTIDSAWLTRTLRAARLLSGSQSVESFEAQPIGVGFGQTGASDVALCGSPTVTSRASQRIRESRHK